MEEDIFSVLKSGDVEKFRELIEHKDFDINGCNEHGVALTHLSSELGLIDAIELLIEKGANFNTKTNAGDTPVHCAVQHNNNDVVRRLLKLPLLVDEPNELGNTALHYACFWTNRDIALELIQLDCDISLRNKVNQTPLDVCSDELAEELATAYTSGEKKAPEHYKHIHVKHCPSAMNSSCFKLEISVNQGDINLSAPLWRNAVEDVWEAELRGRKLAVRKLRPGLDKKILISIFIQEYSNLLVMNEDSCVPPAGYFYAKNEIWIVQPRFQFGGTLREFVKNRDTGLPLELGLDISIGVCRGIQYVENNPALLNRFQLHAQSILINDNFEAQINLGQFSFTFMEKEKIVEPCYYAPEALKNKPGSYSKGDADVWSFGIFMYEIFSGKPPYSEMNHMHAGYKIAVLQQYPECKLENTQLEKIVHLCVNPIPSKRPQLNKLQPILVKMRQKVDNK